MGSTDKWMVSKDSFADARMFSTDAFTDSRMETDVINGLYHGLTDENGLADENG